MVIFVFRSFENVRIYRVKQNVKKQGGWHGVPHFEIIFDFFS